MVRKLIGAAAIMLLSAGGGHAQYTGPIRNSPQDDSHIWTWSGLGPAHTPEDAERAEVERRYRETLRTKIPDRKLSNDPWRTVRQAPAATSASTKHKLE